LLNRGEIRNRNSRKIVSNNMTRVSQSLTLKPKGPKAFLRRHVTKKRSLIALILSFAFLFLCGVTGAAGGGQNDSLCVARL
jgi:hypothetical protein